MEQIGVQRKEGGREHKGMDIFLFDFFVPILKPKVIPICFRINILFIKVPERVIMGHVK